MQCPSCSGETPNGMAFCGRCGTPLGLNCDVCGAELLADMSFCVGCGSPAHPHAPTPAAVRRPVTTPEPAAERRICSILFIDLVGFTPLAERRDPEAVRELLSLYYERASSIIANYGGTVEKFIGDAVMAVFGAPVANEDDAERAVRAALDVVASVVELGNREGVADLLARGGVVTGEVAITVGQVAEGMVLGDTVNSASRIQSVAEPGTVLVDEATWRAASQSIVFEQIGELVLKGKREPVNAWRALRVVSQRRGVGRAAIEPPFVGRDGELQVLREQLRLTAEEKRARLVSVMGVAGIGKSRLAWEFLKYVDGLTQDVFWHQGRSPSYGEGVTFWALGEMVRMRAGILESDDPETAFSKLSAATNEFVESRDERKWITSALAQLLGLSDEHTGDREQLFSAWRAFFERIAERSPVVMVFEDLQWADAGLIDFVESIFEWSIRYPILVLTLARPDLMDRRSTWGAGHRTFSALHLEALRPADMRSLLSGLVRELPEEVTSEVLARSEGVPLYAVEIVRALANRGALVDDSGVFRVVGDITSFEVPETLSALIGSRLDALSPDERALIQDAAILGTTFSSSALAAVRGADASQTEASLRDLVRKEILSLDTDPRSPERGHFGFLQGLIRDVAVSRLSRRDRSAKHLAVAAFYRNLDDDELAGVVATHLVAAYEAASDEARTPIEVEAREWLVRAARRAQSLGSHDQAMAYFAQALSVTTERAERADLLRSVGVSARESRQFDAAHLNLDEAIDIYRQLDDHAAASGTELDVLRSLDAERRRLDAATYGQEAFARCDEANFELRAAIGSFVATAFSALGDTSRALEWAELSLKLGERVEDPEPFLRAVSARAVALFDLGSYRQAILLGKGTVALADEVGTLRAQASSRVNLGVYIMDDDAHAALTSWVEAAALARRAGSLSVEILALLNAAEGAAYLGRWDVTREVLTRSEEWGETWVTTLGGLRAISLACAGDFENAFAILDAAEAAAVNLDDRDELSTFAKSQALVCLAAGEFADSRDHARRAIDASPNNINAARCATTLMHAAVWLADAEGLQFALQLLEGFWGRTNAASRLSARGALSALQGNAIEARALYTEAMDQLRALNGAFDVGLVALDAVKVLGLRDPDDAIAKEARDIFVEIGATPFLSRLDELTGYR